MSPWRNRLARSAVILVHGTERLVVRAHPGTFQFFLFSEFRFELLIIADVQDSDRA